MVILKFLIIFIYIFLLSKIKIIMFAGSTFLGFLDRLSVKSLLTGRTGSWFGVLGTIAFIILSFIIFIGPVIYFFQGDYIQGSYLVVNNEDLTYYTGCDFKMAAFFYQKSTNKLANLSALSSIVKPRIYYVAPDGQTFYAPVEACSADYFSSMQNKPHDFKPQDCVIAPNGLGYRNNIVKGLISVIGFTFQPICSNPFVCTYGSIIDAQRINATLDFFSKYYTMLRFTSKSFDGRGKLVQKWYQITSQDWQSQSSFMSRIYAVLQTAKIYIDDSIMPWYNNQSSIFSQYKGRIGGYTIDMINVQSSGTAAFIATDVIQRVYYRDYKKLDWIIGMLGGGIFILFLIFWTVCTCYSSEKQIIQTCQSTTLIRQNNDNLNDIQKPKFNILWYVSRILPFKINFFTAQNNAIENSQRFLDIACIIKKLKVATKNLHKNHRSVYFQSRILELANQQQKSDFTETQIKYELKNSVLQFIKEDPKIPQIYSNHLPMLALCSNEQNEQIKKRISQIISDQKYSKFNIVQFPNRQKSRIAEVCKNIKKYIQIFFTFFDVFGSKPMLSGLNKNYSVLGCSLTLLICILAILTFALTLHNMGIVRTRMDKIYHGDENRNITMTAGSDFRMAVCFSSEAFKQNLIITQNRVANIKFFQYFRDGTSEQYIYKDAVQMGTVQGDGYFDNSNDAAFNLNDYTYCFKPETGTNFTMYGDAHTQKQAFIGIKLTPYCSGTPATCLANAAQTKQKFYDFMSSNWILTYLPNTRFAADVNNIQIIPIRRLFSSPIYNGRTLNYTAPIVETTYMDSLELINDYSSWMMGPYPTPYRQLATIDIEKTNSFSNSLDSSLDPYYQYRLMPSGVSQQVIFTSYKVDFLFAVIGGSFMFFYFFFGCFGKGYNYYKLKVKLAEQLYEEDQHNISGCRYFLRWLKLPISNDPILKKIESDIDCLRLAKNADNVYRFSTSFYKTPLEKDLALIYMKERIKEDDRIKLQRSQEQFLSQQDDDENDFYLDWDAKKKQQLRKLNPNVIQNVSDSEQQKEINLEKDLAQMMSNMDKQSIAQVGPNLRQQQRCGTFINSFDLFNSNSQFTLDGQRTVRSFFGGFCCVILFIFLCVLVSHFLTIYFSNWHEVSYSKRTEQNPEITKIELKTDQNFKLAVSFNTLSHFNFEDVSSLMGGVKISLVKYKINRDNNGIITTNSSEHIDLVKCSSGYFNGFIDPHQDQNRFSQITNAYCLPGGVELILYGNSGLDRRRQYFSIKIYNDPAQNITGPGPVNNLLSKYIPKYHISSPSFDYSLNGSIHHNVISTVRSMEYLSQTSIRYNITLQKNFIKYDTTLNIRNERPTINSYELDPAATLQFASTFDGTSNMNSEFFFTHKDVYNQIIIKKLKASDLFGIVGGCIVLLFFGIGMLPRSYNQYKFRYILGTKLYTILGHKRKSDLKTMKSKLKKSTSNINFQPAQLSECRLFLAWFLSFWGFITNNYNDNNTLRLATLIESKAGIDLNIFKFVKTLYACQNAIKKLHLVQGDINLCKVFPKQIVCEEANEEIGDELKQNIIEHYNPLIDAAKINKFTEWQLNTILKAKEQRVDIRSIFQEKLLDSFMGIDRGLISSVRGGGSKSNKTKGIKRSMNQLEDSGIGHKDGDDSKIQMKQSKLDQNSVQAFQLDD